MHANLLPEMTLASSETKAATSANTGGDPLTNAHVRNWMQSVRDRKPANAPIEAAYSHSIALIMANAAYRTGMKATFYAATPEVMVGGKPFTL